MLRLAALGCLLCLPAATLRSGTDAAASEAAGLGRGRRIRLIGAGHQRTGTQSLTAALLMLGYNPAHAQRFIPKKPFRDGFTGLLRTAPGSASGPAPRARPGTSLLQRSEQELAIESYPLSTMNMTVLNAWMQLADGGSPEPALQTLLDNGFDATTSDVPTYAIAKELIKRFPDAKVILAVHPGGPLAWVDSMTRICWSCREGWEFWQTDFGAKLSPCVRELMKSADNMTMKQKLVCAQEYVNETQHIRDLVPPEQLLMFAPTDGWGPLCNFLQVRPPSKPFPKLDTFGSRRRGDTKRH